MRVSRWVVVGSALLGLSGCSDQQATESGGDPDGSATPPPVTPAIQLLPPTPKALYLETDKGNLYAAVLINDQHPALDAAATLPSSQSTTKLSVNLPPPQRPKEAAPAVAGIGARTAPGVYRAEQPLVVRAQRTLLGDLQLQGLTTYGEWLFRRAGGVAGSAVVDAPLPSPMGASASSAEGGPASGGGGHAVVWWSPGASLADMVTVWRPRGAGVPRFDAATDQLIFVAQHAGAWHLVRRGLNGVETATSLQPLVAALPGSPHLVLEDLRDGVALLSVNSHLWYAVTVADGAAQALDEICAHARLFTDPEGGVWVAGQSCGGKLLLQSTDVARRLTLAAPPESVGGASSGFKLPNSSYDVGGFLPTGEFAFRHTAIEAVSPSAPLPDDTAEGVPPSASRRHTMLKVVDPIVSEKPTLLVDYDLPLTAGSDPGPRVVVRWRDVVGRVGVRFLVRGVDCRVQGMPTDYYYTAAGYTIDMPCAFLSIGEGGTAIGWHYGLVELDGAITPLARYEWPTRLAAFWPESDLLLLEVQRDTPSLVAIRLSTGKEIATLARSAVWTTARTVDDEPHGGGGGLIEALDQQTRWPGLLIQTETNIPGDYEIGVVGPEQIAEQGIGVTKLATVRGAVRRVGLADWKATARTDVVMADNTGVEDPASELVEAVAAPLANDSEPTGLPPLPAIPATSVYETGGGMATDAVPSVSPSEPSSGAAVDDLAAENPVTADAAADTAPPADGGTAPSEPQPALPPAPDASAAAVAPAPYSVANLLDQYTAAPNSVLTIVGVQLNSVAPIQNLGIRCLPQKPAGAFEGQLAPGKTTSVTFTIKIPVVAVPRDCTLIASDAANHWTNVQTFHIDLAIGE
ncbi:MAG: hypothetical protein HY696_04680 [Deltaproteobacteria bacterium]|nr:hypothetical protein [Deltaproteobacteria bacterium]